MIVMLMAITGIMSSKRKVTLTMVMVLTPNGKKQSSNQASTRGKTRSREQKGKSSSREQEARNRKRQKQHGKTW